MIKRKIRFSLVCVLLTVSAFALQATAQDASTESVLAHHLQALGEADIDAIMSDYAENAVLITPGGPLHGLDAIRQLFEGMIADPMISFEILQQAIEGEVAYIVWKAETKRLSIPLGTDTFVIRDGKIVAQTFAAQMETKSDTEANKAIQRRVLAEIWNQKNLDLTDELYAPDFVFHDPAESGIAGPEGYKQFVTMYTTAFPDLQFTVDEQIASGDKVTTRWTATGTHKGDLMGIPPTGVHATTIGISTVRIVDGRVVEEVANWDALGQMQQLGVIAPGRPAPEDYAWSALSDVTGDPGDPEANKALITRFAEEVWNEQNLDVVDEIFSVDMIGHNPPVDFLYGPSNIGTLKQAVTDYLTAFPDLHAVIDEMFAEGDRVVEHWTATGTHKGELAGIPPSGNKAKWTGVTTFRFADGKIVEMWWAWDTMGMMQQLTRTE